jgi:hypothetical protein
MHEKTGDIALSHTPDTEHVLGPGEKRGSEKAAVEQLDDDVLNRLSKRAAETRKRLVAK